MVTSLNNNIIILGNERQHNVIIRLHFYNSIIIENCDNNPYHENTVVYLYSGKTLLC